MQVNTVFVFILLKGTSEQKTFLGQTVPALYDAVTRT